MTVGTVLDKLATIQATITGITKAYGHDDLPNSLKTAQLPAFINLPGAATSEDVFGQAAEVETRTYRMLLYVTPIERPSDIATRMNRVEPFFDRVKDKFRSYALLDSLTDVIFTSTVDDIGLTAMEYAGVLYAGVEFTLDVMEQKA